MAPEEEHEHLLQCLARHIINMRPRSKAITFLLGLEKRHGKEYYENMKQRCNNILDERKNKNAKD